MTTGYTDTLKDIMLTAAKSTATFISLHTDDPSTTGANEVTGGTYARVATTWPAPSASSMVGSQVTINVPAGVTIKFWGLWTLVSGGTFELGEALPANESFGGAGTYLFTPTLAATG